MGRAATALLCFLLTSTELAAQNSMLRISCEGESVGAEVSANGQFKGECPLDMQVAAGELKLQVIKKVDASRVRVFEQELRIGDGIVKRVEVVLGAPQLTPEGRKIEDERIRLEQIAAQAREEDRRKAAADALVLVDKQVDQLLQAKRAQRGIENPECPDCPPLILPPGGRRNRNGTSLPNFSDPELESWTRAIERELAAYVNNPQESFRLPAQSQAPLCEGADANLRRLVGLVSLADETPEKREAYRAMMAPSGVGESTYYFRDVRMWPVQVTCKNGKLDGPVDVWIYSMSVSDHPDLISASPRLTHLRFTAVDGEPVGAIYHVARTSGGVTEYKDAATQKMMNENSIGDSETISFTYSYAPSAGNARSITVSNSTFSNRKYEDAGSGVSTITTFPLGAGRTEQLYYQGLRLTSRSLQKDGRSHGPMVIYAQTIKVGFLIPDIKTSDTIHCYREGVLIQADPCNVQ